MPTSMGQFGIGFFEEFLLLLITSTFLGLCIFVTLRFVIRMTRGKTGLLASSGPLFLLAIFFFFASIPRINAAVVSGFPYFVAIGALCAILLTLAARSRGFLAKGLSGTLFVAAGAVLLTFSIFQFVIAGHTSFHGEELAAILEAIPTETDPGYDASTEDYTLVYHDPVPAVELNFHYSKKNGELAVMNVTLPGEKWGVGGHILHVNNWFFLFGDRTFYQLTGLDVKFQDNEMPHRGKNLVDYDPARDTQKRLDEEIPFLNRKLREICRIKTQKLSYEDFVYQPVGTGPTYWGIYVKPTGGFVPRRLDHEQYGELLDRFMDRRPPML